MSWGSALTLQVGLPHSLDLAALAFLPRRASSATTPPYEGVFAEHLHRQIHATVATVGADQVLFQIESQRVLTEHLDGAALESGGTVGEMVVEVINRATPQARFGIHLCLESRGDQPAVEVLGTTAPIVNAVAEMTDALERPEALEYVHLPIATRTTPPSAESRVYRPLVSLREVLPPETRIIAGLVDERQSLREQLHVRDLIEDTIGEPVDIATPCGLGRRTPEVAHQLVTRMMELASG